MAHKIGRLHRNGKSTQRIAAAIVATALTTTGCQGMAITSTEKPPLSAGEVHNTVADWPLGFMRHNFGIATYALEECTVFYANRLHERGGVHGPRPAREDVHPNALSTTGAGHIMIRNFPEPARVKWRSRDGTPLEADVDIGQIFKDELIVHDTPREDIKEGVSIGNPDIVMEVNDRTINVYMRSFIPLKAPRIAGNPHSDYRRDLVLAWSKTY